MALEVFTCPVCQAAHHLCPSCSRMFYPGRIDQGRWARNMTKKELSGQLGITARLLNRWIDGTEAPSEDQILQLCMILGFSRRFFARPPFTLEGPTFICSVK